VDEVLKKTNFSSKNRELATFVEATEMAGRSVSDAIFGRDPSQDASNSLSGCVPRAD
jgi:hypothetical protein